ncbi:hypothetical protein K0651_12875 [Ornithinimicrobium sp. Arc0846-15]|nr:hypothetical protein [Ornithinimicrobium laminariae]
MPFTGARTQLISELRLIAPSWDPGVFEWQTFHATIRPQEEDTGDFAALYAIKGRETALRFVKFTLDLTDTLPEPTDTTLRLEARLDGSDAG